MKKFWVQVGLGVFFVSALSAKSEDHPIFLSLKRQAEVSVDSAGLQLPAHFVFLFGNQDEENYPENSHTFGTYLRLNEEGEADWQSISWLPDDFPEKGRIEIFRGFFAALRHQFSKAKKYGPKTGENFSIPESLLWARSDEKEFYASGPRLISEEIFLLGKMRVKKLASGLIEYIADDRATRNPETAVNCMHAVGDLTEDKMKDGGFLDSGFGIWGIKGTKHVLKHILSLDKKLRKSKMNKPKRGYSS